MTTLSLGRAPARLMSVAVLLLVMLVSIVGPATPVARAAGIGAGYIQSFDGIGTTATATLPIDFRADRLAGAGTMRTVGTYAAAGTVTTAAGGANLATSAANGIYNFGSGTTTTGGDRAIGFLSSASATQSGNLYALLTNDTAAPFSSLQISYDVEKYRSGSNAAGFSIQLHYSADGANWTSAGTNFLTSFPADAANTGFATAPGATVAVTNQALNVDLPSGGTIYLAWNYSVTSGTTTSNAQALAIDNISVTGVGGGMVAPTITTQPASQSISAGQTATLSVVATGSAPLSYQWYAGTSADTSSPIAGAIAASYTTPALAVGAYNYWVRVSNGVAPDANSNTATITVSEPGVVPISQVQGSGSDVTGAGPFTVEAIVVGDYQAQGSGQLRGFFLQEEDADADADQATSEGIFVFCEGCPVDVAVGDLVRVTGAASEFFGMSQLSATSAGSVTVLGSGQPSPTPAALELPVPGVPGGDSAAATAAINAYYEAFEGMLVTFPDTLSVSEYFELARYGQVILTEGGRPHTFTAVNTPTAAGLINHEIDLARRTIILDDTDNRQNRPSDPPNTPYYHPVPGLSTSNFFRGGDTITGLTGVLHWSFAGQSGTDAWRIRPVVEQFSYAFTSADPRPAPPELDGRLKVASFNVLNYFVSIDTANTCAPTLNQDCRGADSVQELERQRAKLIEALVGLDADVLGLMEMENTPGVEPLGDSTYGIVPGLNAALGADVYAYVDTGVIGTDAIRVGIIYKKAAVAPAGSYAILDSSVDPRFVDTRNRPALAQTFTEMATGARFTVVVNHLKSKGSGCGPGDDDTTTGQGNCNGTRTLAAQALADWLAGDPTNSGDPDALIIGDLNSYAKEDPIVALQNAGYIDLVAAFGGAEAYGYVFDGQLGYLDHALSNASLTPQVAGVAEWHINADEIPLFDYNDDQRTADEAAFEEESDSLPLYAPDEFRTSDHDPVIVGLTLTPPPVDVAPEITTHPQSQTINAGQTATLSVVATGSAPLSYQWYAGTSGDTSSPIAGATAASYTTPALAVGAYNYWVRVSNGVAPDANSNTATITVNEPGVAPAITTHPQSQTINAGQTATLSVVATGTAPLSYQWYQGTSGTTTTPVGTDSASFTTPALSATTSYWVRVSNSAGSADSNTATITVNPAPPADLVISQVYGGGGNSGATLRNDFIELYNRSGSPISVSGWSVQYAAATGTSWQVTTLSGMVQPGRYYLIQQAAGANTLAAPLPTPDAIGVIAMSANNGKVALVSSTTALSGACPTAGVIDFVGFGTANCFEGAGAAPGLTNTTAALRAGDGATDTNNNNLDFATGAPNPRNSSVGDAAPEITTHPQSQAIPAGQTATLSVVATGTDPLSYQWYSGNSGDTASPIEGATAASYTTPALAAGTYNYWVRVSNGVAPDADSTTATVTAAIAICDQPFTPIYSIQGTGLSAAITGTVTVEGVVVGDFEGATTEGINGFYLQDETGDGDAATSDGIFVFTGIAPGVNTAAAGERVRVTGFARERFNETTLNGSNSNSAAVPAASIVKCGTATVTPTTVTLPVASTTFLERYEGMLVNLPQSLVISEYFNYDQFGEYVLALPIDDEARPYTPTAVEEPGSAGYQTRLDLNQRSRILIDDGLGVSNPATGNTHPNGQPFSLSNSFRGGDTVQGVTGVLGFGFSNYRVQPTAYGTYTAANPRPAAPTPVGGTLRVGAFNTLNYFLTADYPNITPLNPLDNKCGPLQNVECRGWDADQTSELTRQRDKLLVALVGINADILGLNELENTAGVEPLADIVAGLNDQLGAGTYAYIETGTIGTDAIKVGMIYKPGVVTPVGPFELLTSADDTRFRDTLNRPVLAQTFRENATGAIFTVAAVHLKSKGSGCGSGDDDTTTGQGNCNGTRTLAAQALVDWLDNTFDDPDFLIVGDMNSYAKEDPIDAVLAGPDDVAGSADDYINLIQRFIGDDAYSYVFDGQFGYLDHALASTSMNAQVTGATEWHINADEPDLIDYDTSFKSPVQDTYYAPDAYRTSDHDPVIVGLDPNAAPVAVDDTFSTDEDVAVSGNVLANDSDGNDDTLTAALVGAPAGVALAADGTFTFTPPENASGTYTFEYIVSDGSLSDTGLVTISVLAVNDLPTITALPGTALCTPGSVANGAFQVATSDVEPGALTITTSSGNPLITAVVTGSTVTFSVAGSSQAQSGTVTITVTDADGATAAITASVWAGRGHSDSRTGGAGIDVMFGLGGGDTLRGGGGFDLLCGGAGADTLFGDDGADTLDGGAGSDKLRGGGDDDRLFGGDGADDLFGDGGADTLEGGAGADLLRGGGDDDQIFGGAGADNLFGDDGDDTLTGGADRDSFDGGAGTDTATDRAGNESQIRVP